MFFYFYIFGPAMAVALPNTVLGSCRRCSRWLLWSELQCTGRGAYYSGRRYAQNGATRDLYLYADARLAPPRARGRSGAHTVDMMAAPYKAIASNVSTISARGRGYFIAARWSLLTCANPTNPNNF